MYFFILYLKKSLTFSLSYFSTVRNFLYKNPICLFFSPLFSIMVFCPRTLQRALFFIFFVLFKTTCFSPHVSSLAFYTRLHNFIILVVYYLVSHISYYYINSTINNSNQSEFIFITNTCILIFIQGYYLYSIKAE
jgi:hypothetical protein